MRTQLAVFCVHRSLAVLCPIPYWFSSSSSRWTFYNSSKFIGFWGQAMTVCDAQMFCTLLLSLIMFRFFLIAGYHSNVDYYDSHGLSSQDIMLIWQTSKQFCNDQRKQSLSRMIPHWNYQLFLFYNIFQLYFHSTKNAEMLAWIAFEFFCWNIYIQSCWFEKINYQIFL